MVLQVLEDTIYDVDQETHEYDNAEKVVDSMVFAVEKLHNEHPTSFLKLAELLKSRGKCGNTKKRRDNEGSNFSWPGVVWAELYPSTHP